MHAHNYSWHWIMMQVSSWSNRKISHYDHSHTCMTIFHQVYINILCSVNILYSILPTLYICTIDQPYYIVCFLHQKEKSVNTLVQRGKPHRASPLNEELQAINGHGYRENCFFSRSKAFDRLSNSKQPDSHKDTHKQY